MRLTFCGLFILLGLAHSRAEEPVPIPEASLKRTQPVDYEKEVAPILANKCQACHSGKTPEGDFDTSSYSALIKGGKHGPVLALTVEGKASRAEASRLWLMTSRRMKPIMPPKSDDHPLTSEEVTILKLWIDQGGKGPTSDKIPNALPAVALTPPPARLNPIRAIALTPDKKTLVVGRGNKIHLYDLAKGECRASIGDSELKTKEGKPLVEAAAHIAPIDSLAMRSDGNVIITGGYGEVALWEIGSGKLLGRVGGFADRVTALTFSADGSRFATGGGTPTQSGEIRIYDGRDGKLISEIKSPHSDTVFGLAFSPDGKLLASASADRMVKVFDCANVKMLKTFDGHTNHVLDVTWSKDGKKVISGGADNVIKVWDYEKGEKIRDIFVHQNQISRLTLLPNTSFVVSVGGDGRTIAWDIDNGGVLRRMPDANDFLNALAVAADGSIVATAGEDGIVRVYDGPNGKLLKTINRPDGRAEVKKDVPPKDPKKN